MNHPYLDDSYETRLKRKMFLIRWKNWHIDPLLVVLLISITLVGLFILYSASNENLAVIEKQAGHLLLAFTLMIVAAQIPPRRYQQWAPGFFVITLILLIAVLLVGKVGQGARRWIVLGSLRFQPSEIMRLTLPMMLAWFLSEKPLPPSLKQLALSAVILIVPAALTAKQPDLGTAILITLSGISILLFSGISWKMIVSFLSAGLLAAPLLWHFMHRYQKERLLTFLNPDRDPLGSGYHIIQSKIAVGSGGLVGKGWLHGTQSHLSFLPAHTTDFIFAVAGEELGLLGCAFILLLFLTLFARCLYLGTQAQNGFSRLLVGSLSLTFILSAFINIGMVIGVLPVVGVPLPLISYGGSATLVNMIGFGIIMSVHTHKKLYPS